MPRYDVNALPKDTWNLALTTRIAQLDERLHRYDGWEMNERLEKLLPGIEQLRNYYTAKLYENLTKEQQAVVDRMKPPGKVWSRARSKTDL